jgi:hypothetical protein
LPALVALVLAKERCQHEVAEHAAMSVTGSCQQATSPRGGQMCCSTGGTGAGRGATQSPMATATVMVMAKTIGMVTMVLIIPYKNELNDSAQKGQTLPLGKMCCRKQTS